MTRTALCRAAHVSTVDLPRHFDSLSECFSAALSVRLSRLAARLEQASAAAGQEDPIARARAAIAALAELLARDPATARNLLVEAGALTEPPEDDDKRTWAGSLRELVERLLEPIDVPSPTVRRICAGAAVGALRSVYLNHGVEGLAEAGEEIAAAALGATVRDWSTRSTPSLRPSSATCR